MIACWVLIDTVCACSPFRRLVNTLKLLERDLGGRDFKKALALLLKVCFPLPLKTPLLINIFIPHFKRGVQQLCIFNDAPDQRAQPIMLKV